MRIVLDENVCLRLARVLREDGHEVFSVAESQERSLSDAEVWTLVCETHALLITRDYHFTNGIRFNAARCLGIVFLRHGNLKASDEMALVRSFLASHVLEEFRGKLVTLFPGSARIRRSL